jgi:hypothetical protein
LPLLTPFKATISAVRTHPLLRLCRHAQPPHHKARVSTPNHISVTTYETEAPTMPGSVESLVLEYTAIRAHKSWAPATNQHLTWHSHISKCTGIRKCSSFYKARMLSPYNSLLTFDNSKHYHRRSTPSTTTTQASSPPSLPSTPNLTPQTPMCNDLLCHYQLCNHTQHIYGQYGHHLYNDLQRINEPRYLDRTGIPYYPSRACREPRRERLPGWCPPCGYGHLERQGWNFRGYGGGRERWY